MGWRTVAEIDDGNGSKVEVKVAEAANGEPDDHIWVYGHNSGRMSADVALKVVTGINFAVNTVHAHQFAPEPLQVH